MQHPALESASFSQKAQALVHELLENQQYHLFDDWDPPGVCEPEKRAFLEQLLQVNANYPGGIAGYTDNARRLLAQSRQGLNPFEGYRPEQPDAVDLSAMDGIYDQMESVGQAHFDRTGVVLVAGGLGERLGHNGIKLDLPVEAILNTSYLAHYADCLLAMEARMATPKPVPFVIMVSEDTHAPTLRALEDHNYYGLRQDQVHILKQELVPALQDNEARLAKEGPYALILKPHGHGDVHMLLQSSGLAAQLHAQGIEHLVFIQDTNGQVFNALPAALGVSIEREYDFNSLAVNRVPGEAVGGLARLVKDDHEMTLNIEYNQLDPLLRATINPEGDVPGANGFSVFPGNINILVIRLASYVKVLEKSKGIIAEFVNPKYADEARTEFNKPARLETMMQDLPKLLGPEHKVGVTVFHRAWCFSPNKNNVEEAAKKHAAGSPPESAATAESDFYLAGRMKAERAGMEIHAEAPQTILGVPFVNGPRVLLRPSFAMTLAEAREKIGGGQLSGPSTLILDGPDIRLRDVRLEAGAALRVHAVPGAKVTIQGRLSGPPGFVLTKLSSEELAAPDTPSALKMRGYRFVDQGVKALRFDRPGEYQVDLATLYTDPPELS
ncbi:MAG: UTP--glucose-1-phosphate uridylyltransferase [Verrucomicrobia bacterium]|nr:UTP--glucose-1-phosphate uridylyltransferase [Verrucomicrobiota bacterium]MCH8514557.1 UTP--glucose-1-phosphate uridylyltransferase [Kiritimatiellia bacterium]